MHICNVYAQENGNTNYQPFQNNCLSSLLNALEICRVLTFLF